MESATITRATQTVTDEQVRLINEIWDVKQLLGHDVGHEAMQTLLTKDGEALSEYKLRSILHDLKNAHRKGEPKHVQSAAV